MFRKFVLAANVFAIFALGFVFVPIASANQSAEVYSGHQGMRGVKISPDGNYIAAIELYEGRQIVHIYGLGAAAETNQILGIPPKYPDDMRISYVRWANNDRLLISMQFASRRGFGNFGKKIYRNLTEYRLLGVNRDGSNVQLLPKPIRQEEQMQSSGSIYDMLVNDPDHVLMTIYKREGGQGRTPFKVNVNTGRHEPVAMGDWGVGNYVVDNSGNTRIRTRYRGLNRIIEARSNDQGSWERIYKYTAFEDHYFQPLEILSDPNKLYVASDRDNGRDTVFEFDLSSLTFGSKIWSNPKYDINDIRMSPGRERIVGVGYLADYYEIDALDPEFGRKYNVLKQAFPKTSIEIESVTRDDGKWIVSVDGPQFPPTYFIYDTINIKLQKVGSPFPNVDRATLSDMKSVSYTARDGLEIPAYLTLPRRGSAPYPTVILPHGGPSSRDYISFDAEVQFLASRGYAVLQPNFRGSTGYGNDFMHAGFRQWGLKMQDDVTDGANFLTSQGIADPSRMCIVGWSYGGYAALMGAVKTPDLFKCVVAGAAVSDIPLLLKQEYNADENGPTVGGWRERGQLRETSPARNVDVITAPILLVHGDYDQTVRVEQSRIMAGKLRNAGKPHKFVILEKDNHGRSIPGNETIYLQEVEAFLAQHIGR